MPAACPKKKDPLGVDTRINVKTIDQWLGRPDCAYFDARMVEDTAHFEDIDGSRYLNTVLEGFKVVPFPYIGTLSPMPFKGGYVGSCLFSIEWGKGERIMSVTPNYKQSERILKELFPRDKKIIITCGIGGYSNLLRKLLIYLGWNADDVYNAGGMWKYKGKHAVTLIDPKDEGKRFLWRADIAHINDFEHYTPLG